MALLSPCREVVLQAVFIFAFCSMGWAQNSLWPPADKQAVDRPYPQSAAFPNVDYKIHNNGKFWTTINNTGVIGNVYGFGDVLGNRQAPTFYYPRYSRIRYGVYACLWVGGIIGNDTLVSTALGPAPSFFLSPSREFWPESYPAGEYQTRSSEPGSPFFSTRANAQQEYVAVYYDTSIDKRFVGFNEWDNRFHKPLGLKVTQTSYSWTYKYAEDFIIVDYAIENIGDDVIKKAWVGIYYWGANYFIGELPYPALDDVEGYLHKAPSELRDSCDNILRLAYIVDNDGQPNGSMWDMTSTTNVFGIAPLSVPRGANLNNFNWWVYYETQPHNWGPRRQDPLTRFRRFPEGPGVPYGDKASYYLMSHPEIDYHGYKAAVDLTAEGWIPPHELAETIADGHSVQFVTSFGPFTLDPGEVEHLTVVLVVGEDVHTVPSAYRNSFDPANPQPFIDYLNFEDLTTNLRWARQVFDNPGVDTDRDGDSGSYYFQVDEETGDSAQVFCTGDGVPDFVGAAPPPAPPVRVLTEQGKIIVRWNGRNTENFFDTFSGLYDFEGYRVYLARSTTDGDISVMGSYDTEDYNRFTWIRTRRDYRNNDLPFSLDELKELYGDSFDPDDYPRHSPLIVGGESYYFGPVDFNSSDLSDPKGIHKLYPDATLDTNDVDEEGRMRYYEYEFVIDNLLPTVPYWVSVTAFDFGYPAKSLEPLESSPYVSQVPVYAVKSHDRVLKNGKLDVYCYPNPYRVDAGYAARGIENRFDDLSVDRSRILNFANLPDRCTIGIYTLDGDLVRQIEHDEPESSGTSSIERFDLIGRNHQAVVSGLYYWVVESDAGSQVGKLVIIK